MGYNLYGQLGRAGTTNQTTWGDTGQPASAIVAGMHHGYALHNSTVWSVGHNGNGQLGLGDTTSRHTFTEVPAFEVE